MDGISAEGWQQIDGLFAAALERPPREREAFLATVSGSDPQLYQAVLSLLESAAAAEAQLGESASDYAEPLLAEMQARQAREDLDSLPQNGRIGPYRILRDIGRGGMGAVYLAERADGEFEKRVALKLVKRGMDTDEVLRRFRHERQILATLEHPHIARLLDGGATEDGRPYLVMEYIEGEPITEYCDARRLTVEERLRLFTRVCAAIQFAHRRLVVHRDLKPSNILVTADGMPKLLDFGRSTRRWRPHVTTWSRCSAPAAMKRRCGRCHPEPQPAGCCRCPSLPLTPRSPPRRHRSGRTPPAA